MANFNTNIIIKREICEEDWMLTDKRQEFDVWDGMNNKQSHMGEELKVKEEVGVDVNIDKYLRMWKSLYPLVNDETKISIYKINNGDIRQTMAKIREINENEKIQKQKGVKNVQCIPYDNMILGMNVLSNHLTNLGKSTLENQKLKQVPLENLKEVVVKKEIKVNVKEEVRVNVDIDKYLRMWKSLYPLVNDKTKISIYKNNDCNLRKTMAKIREMNGNEKNRKEKCFKNVTCNHCDKIFSSMNGLERHLTSLNKFTREKPNMEEGPCENQKKISSEISHECKHCEKTFSNKIDLMNHLKGHINDMKLHPEDKPYKCSHCGKGFLWRSQLNQHLRWIKTMDEPYECSYCNKTSLWKCQIEAHMATHIEENPKMHLGEW